MNLFEISQVLAMPTIEEDMSKPEHVPVIVEEDMSKPEFKPKNEVVDAFREEIDRQFIRFQRFYDQTNADMRNYRLAHVELISEVYMAIMESFGDRIEEVRIASYELSDLIDARIEEVGDNACIRDVVTRREANSVQVGTNIQNCAIYANTTLTNLLNNVFYPAFAQVQTETSLIPISVIDVLARGNVLEDEQAIIEYLNARFDVLEFQWLSMVSQVLRWETNRFRNDGLFLNDQVAICMGDATWEYLLTNSLLEGDIQAC
jgi:hypothetical protein